MQNHAISAPANLYPLPSPRPGHRFVPAKVGHRNAASVIVLIEDPLWCTEDHVAEPVVDVADVMHRTDAEGFGVTSFVRNIKAHELYAYIEADPTGDAAMKAAHVVVEDGGNEYSYLTPAMADELADKVVGFASHLRTLARQVRQANQVTGDSDVDMDEALRRIRSGGAA